MLERERELREREKQRDAWYRHAQGLGQQSSGRLEREREEWERERARVREDEYRVSEARQREEGEYPRVLADVSGFAAQAGVSLSVPLATRESSSHVVPRTFIGGTTNRLPVRIHDHRPPTELRFSATKRR